MKKIFLLLPLIILLFAISCSDMVKEISNPAGVDGNAIIIDDDDDDDDGIVDNGSQTGLWDQSKWDEAKWGD